MTAIKVNKEKLRTNINSKNYKNKTIIIDETKNDCGTSAEYAQDEIDPEALKPAIVTDYEKAVAERDDYKDKYIRLLAELDNIRKNNMKQRENLMKYKYEGIASDLLTVLDDFDRCIKNISDETTQEGVNLIKHKMLSILSKNSIKPMEVKEGDEFNTDLHEAVSVVPAGDDMKGKVIAVTDTGYTYSDKVIRYAKVVVGQ